MEGENEREGITLSELWRIIKKRLWIILIITLICTVGGYLMLRFFVNPAAVFYTIDFTLNYPGKEELKYPDGTPFYYQDIISEEMLERVKATNPKFSNIDVERLVGEDLITITVEMEDEETEDIEQYTETYTIKVSQKDFATRELATEFLRAVANAPIDYVKERAAALDYSLSRDAYEGAYSFRDRIELLTAARALILGQYDSWIDTFRESYAVSGRALKDYRSEVEIVFSNEKRENLLRELSIYDYVPQERLSERIEELTKEKETNEKKIAELKAIVGDSANAAGGSDTMEGVAQKLADLKVTNVDIDRKLAALQEDKINAFDAVLDEEFEKLSMASENTKEVASALFEQETRAMFGTSSAVQEGGSNIFIISVGIFVVVFLLLSAIVCIAEYPKKEQRDPENKENKENK